MWLSFFCCLAIALVAYGIIQWIYSTQPKAKRVGATKKSAMLVNVIPVSLGNYQPKFITLGKVEAATKIELSPEVSGKIIYRSDKFDPGSYLKKGELLYQIDAIDFKHQIDLRQSELLAAQSELSLELGRQNIAQQELSILETTPKPEQKNLILRQPQLQAVKSKVDFAKAMLDQAKVNLSRTKIFSPFDAFVLNKKADLGSRVSTGQTLGQIVGTEEYRVLATLPLNQLKWLNIGENGSIAKIYDEIAWGENYRKGEVTHLHGVLEKDSRLAQILISIKDPLCLKKEHSQLPKMMLGAMLKVELLGKPIHQVIRLDRRYLRKNNTTWVMNNDLLNIVSLQIALSDENYVYVTSGLKDGDLVITTNLSRVSDGAALRRNENSSSLTDQK